MIKNDNHFFFKLTNCFVVSGFSKKKIGQKMVRSEKDNRDTNFCLYSYESISNKKMTFSELLFILKLLLKMKIGTSYKYCKRDNMEHQIAHENQSIFDNNLWVYFYKL